MSENNQENNLNIKTEQDALKIESGDALGINEVRSSWNKLRSEISKSRSKQIIFDASKLKQLDTSGAAMIAYLQKSSKQQKKDFEIIGASSEINQQLEVFLSQSEEKKLHGGIKVFFENIGKDTCNVISGVAESISFVGMLTAAFFRFILNPLKFRWKDAAIISELSGVNSFGICAVIGMLFGLILSFQSANSMKDFGAEIYVATLVSLSLFRVLGPFIAAVLFAARSGSAFAAEIGTMKVNEEIDALVTMGINPISFLALPRVLAGLIFVPLLTLFVNLFGLIGMFFVMSSFGYSYQAIYNQTILLTELGDLMGGVFKAMIFGILVAGVGCLRGMQTTTGSQAVGQAATRAVVSGIVLVVVAEGIFSLIFTILGI